MADLDFIKKQLMDIFYSLSRFSEDDLLHGLQEPSYPCFKMLDQMAAMDVDDREAEEIRKDSELQQALAHISKMKKLTGYVWRSIMPKRLFSPHTPGKR